MKEGKKTFITVQDMVLVAVFTALIAVCSWITIPAMAGQVPFTLQTFAVFVTAGVLGAKRGVLSVFVYIPVSYTHLKRLSAKTTVHLSMKTRINIR